MELHTFYFSLSINVRLGHCSRDDKMFEFYVRFKRVCCVR